METNRIPALKKIVNLLALDKKDILQILYYAIFAGIISLSLPLGIQAIINLLQGAQISSSWIILVIIVTLGVGFAGGLQILQLDIIENIQQKLFVRTSFDLIYRIPKIRVRELIDKYPPELANRFFDVINLQKGLQKLLLDVPAAVLQILLGLLLLSLYHPFFIVFGFLLVILFYILLRFTFDKALVSSLQESKSKYKVAYWVQQVAKNYISLKIASNNIELNKNNKLVESYLEHRQNHFSILKSQFKIMVIFKVTVTAGLLIIGGLLVLNQQMNIGQFVAAEIIILLLINSVEKLVLGLETIYDVSTAIEKLEEIGEKKLDFNTDTLSQEISLFPLHIFRLQSSKLSVADLVINRGDQINVVGNDLKTRDLFYYLTGVKKSKDGKIYFDGREIYTVSLKNYRNYLGLVLRDDQIFEGTLWENLTLNRKDIKEKDVFSILSYFNLIEEIQTLPFGLQQYIVPNGDVITFKLEQLIFLLRALLKKPKMLFVEHAFANPDSYLEKLITYTRENEITLIISSNQKLSNQLKIVEIKE